MATPGGTVTQKDLFTDDALKFGDPLVKEFEKVIFAQKQMLDGAKELSLVVNSYRKIENQQQFIDAKNAEKLATEKIVLGIKQEEAALLSIEKVKQESLRTRKLNIDVEQKEQKAKDGTIKLTIEERVQNEIATRQAKQFILAKLNLTETYSKLSRERIDAKNKLRELILTEGEGSKATRQAAKEYEALDLKVRKADAAVGDFTKNVGNYPTIGQLTKSIKDLFGAFGLIAGVGAVTSILKDSYQTIKQFEQGIADLSAITGAGGKDLDYLKKQAVELGRETKGGAIAVVEAYKLIASAKPELLEDVKALNQVTEATITLAKASGLELPEAAKKLTDAMNQFGAPASEAAKYVDVLAAGAKYGSAEIPQLTDAILEFGAVAKNSNVDIKESVGLVELLAEKGIKGAEAGTAIKNILLEVNSGFTTKEARAELDKYGISFEKLKDKTIPFSDKLELLKPLLSDTTSIVNTFKKENAAAAISLIENTNRIKELTGKVGEFGVAEEQAAIRMNTLEGKTIELSGTYDSFILSIGNGSGVVSDFFKIFISGATGALNGLIRLNSTQDELIEKAKQKGETDSSKEFEKRFQNAGFMNSSDVERAIFVMQKAQKDYENVLKAIQDNNAKIEGRTKGKLGVYGALFDFSGSQKLKEDLEFAKSNLEGVIKLAKEKAEIGKIKPPKETAIVPENETDVDKKKRLAEDKKSNEERLAMLKKVADSEYELQKQRLEQTLKFNDEITSDDKLNDDIRIQSALNSQKLQFDLLLLTKNHLLSDEKLIANDRKRIDEDYASKKIEISKKTALEIDKINLFDLGKYQEELDAKVKLKNKKSNDLESIENDRFKKELQLLKGNQKAIEDATKKHEEELWKIKHNSALAIANIQYDSLVIELYAFKKQSDGSKESTKIIGDLELKLSEYRKRLTELGLETYKKGEDDKVKTTKQKTEEILNISSEMLGAISNLANAFSNAKIQKIDDEIAASDAYYANEIEKAGDDQRKKDIIQKEAEKKRQVLEKQKREEAHKLAVFNKAVTIAQIAIQTALSVMKGFSESGYVGAILAGVLGAISLATAIATPIPKYKDGRKSGPAELAYVGDGGRKEVISNPDGSKPRVTPSSPTLVNLLENEIVHSSEEEYHRFLKASILSSVFINNNKMNDFQAASTFDFHNEKLIDEMKEVKKAIKNQKQNIIINVPKINIDHALWANNIKNWNS